MVVTEPWLSGVEPLFLPAIVAAPAQALMRVLAQVEQLHLLDADLHHKEVIWDGSVLREFWGEGRFGLKGLSWLRPAPKGSSTGGEGPPADVSIPGRHLCG